MTDPKNKELIATDYSNQPFIVLQGTLLEEQQETLQVDRMVLEEESMVEKYKKQAEELKKEQEASKIR